MTWKPRHPPIAPLQLETEITDPGGEKTSELQFWRRLKAKDLREATKRGLSESGEDRLLFLLERITGYSQELLDELDAYDYVSAQNVCSYFLSLGPKIDIRKRVSGLSLQRFPESTSESLTIKT